MDRIRNATIRTELNVELLEAKVRRHKLNEKERLFGMGENRIPKTLRRFISEPSL